MGAVRKRDSAAGGLAILAVAACLCWKGMRKVDRRLREKKRRETSRR